MARKGLIVNTAFLAASFVANLQGQWITGYFESGNAVEPISSIPWSKYTHVVQFAAAPGVDSSGNGNGTVSLHWLVQSDITQMIAARPSGKKVLVCIQDNGSHPTAFSQSTSSGMIGTFVANIANFVNSNGYDGVDIDWEMNINSTQYAQLLTQLRAAMPTKVITAAMGMSATVAAAAASQASVDQFNIMCYDMDTPGNGYSWFNDALFQSGNSGLMTCDWRVNPFLAAGVSPGKIGIGLPFYGRRWTGVTLPLVNGIFSTSTVLYNQLASDSSRWQSQYQAYDSTHKSNYLSIPAMLEFDSYTGTQEIQDIAAWIKTKHFGGAMTFSLYYEYLSGQSGDARYPLSTALYTALGGSTGSTSVTSGSSSSSSSGASRQPALARNGVRSVANGATSASPGSLVYAQGTNLATKTLVVGSTPLPSLLKDSTEDVSVTVNGIPAPMYYALPGFVCFQLPWETPPGMATIVVTRNGVSSGAVDFTVSEFSPGIFTTTGNGTGLAWAIYAVPSKINPRAKVAQATSVSSYVGTPATAGDTLYIYAAGLGPIGPDTMPDGYAPCPLTNSVPGPCPASFNPANYSTTTKPLVTIGGVPATVTSAGIDPTYPGLYLVYFEVPAGAPRGNAVPIQLQIGGISTGPTNVTIAIQ